MKKCFLFFILMLGVCSLFAQQSMKGIVRDSKGDPLPFVNILINNSPSEGVNSDINGHFEINHADIIETLTFTYVGFETQILKYKPNKLLLFQEITLERTTYQLNEAIVIAGENPAHRIIRQAVKNRKKNDPQKIPTYSCRTYDKLLADWLPDTVGLWDYSARKGISKKLRQQQAKNIDTTIQNYHDRHIFLTESITERQYKFPDKYSKKVIQNKVAGLKNPEIVAMASEFQPFAFYKPFLTILDHDYLNPVSPGSTEKYFFQLEDTLYQYTDTVFIISFHPRKATTFEGLKGLLYINTHHYALQNVIAEPADTSLLQMKIEQQYQLVLDQWFPRELNFELILPNYPSTFLGLFISGKTFIDRVHFNPVQEGKELKNNDAYTLSPQANQSSDSLWKINRPFQLSPTEKQTYHFLDSLGTEKNFDGKFNFLTGIALGQIPFKKVNIPFGNLLKINEYEGVRLGAGFVTNDAFSKKFQLGASIGYGFNDKSWKYSALASYKFHKKQNVEIGFRYTKDLLEPAGMPAPFENLFVSRRYYAQRFDQLEESTIYTKGDFLTFGQFKWEVSQQRLIPLYIEEGASQQNMTSISLHLRYAYGERFIRLMGQKIPEINDKPIFQLSFEKGVKGFLNGNYDYFRSNFSVEHSFITRVFGETTFLIESGWVSSQAPYSKLFGSSGIGKEFEIFTVENVFQTMDLYEFLSDRFVHLFFRQNIGRLVKTKSFQPELSLVQNIAYGTLQSNQALPEISYKTLEKGYFESGVVLSNLLLINYFNALKIGFGIGAYYRYGYYGLENWKDNFAFRLDIRFQT
ncbi:MAG: hypothetical protein GY705_23430 [Bacteroidetes bacterium]|nr:hypothetical protein [Bacteroidota bacterium]